MQIAPEIDHCHTAADVLASARRVASMRRRLAHCYGRELPAEEPTKRPAKLQAQSPEQHVLRYLSWAGEAIPNGANLKPPTDIGRSITVKRIMLVASELFGITHADLISRRHRQPTADYRACVYWCARQLTAQSLPRIGEAVGGRDHTTVLSGVRKVERAIADGKELGEYAKTLCDAVVSRFSLVKPSAPMTVAMGELFAINGGAK